MKSYQQFFAELKRRQVFKVAGVYGIVAFGVLQVADIALPRLGLPDWTVTFMLAVILLAFPVVLMIAWAFEVTPEGVKKTEAAAPGEIERIVSAPMSQRWPVGLLALVGVVALLGGGWWIGRTTAPGASSSTEGATADVQLAMADLADDDRASIAVLPFADMSAAQDQEYFGDGMTEEILNTLARIRELRVAGRTSAFAYKGESKDLREIGAELGVEYIVEGSVRKDGDQLRITAQLIDASDGSHLWSDSYNRSMQNVFEIQLEIAEAIAGELRVPLGLDGAELVRPTADLEAYDLYLAGRSRIRQRGGQLDEAVRFFEAAIARDSTWAPAWAGLAEAKELIGWWPQSWDEVPGEPEELRRGYWREAEAAAQRALALDPDNASAHVALGSVYRNRYEWDSAEAAYLRALASDPDNPEAHQQYGTMLLMMGRIREGKKATHRAAVLDRVPVRVTWQMAGHIYDGETEEAARILLKGLEDFPTTPVDLDFGLDREYLATGRFEEYAARHTETVAEGASIAAALHAGDPSVLPARLLRRPEVWMALGQPDSALSQAVTLLGNPNVTPSWVWHPSLDPIRDEPEMQDILRGLNLEGRTPDRTPR
jgi:TolB-like protein